jgi:drug/metabolite transporter (DMT)-like permease
VVISPELAAVAFGLLAAFSWGAGDFNGGLATRRMVVVGVVTVAHALGLLLLLIFAVVTREPLPPASDFIWGVLAGLAGLVGLAALYRAFAIGRMGLAAPIASVLSSIVPVLFSITLRGLPGGLQIAGFALGIVSVGLVSYSREGRQETKGLGLAVTAGVSFGVFFILLDRIGPGAVYWPLVAARTASLTAMLVIAFFRRISVVPGTSRLWVIILLAGALDAFGNVFFVQSAQAGRLDITAVVSSLYPAFTIVLARVLLKEHLSRLQMAGIAAALTSIALIAAG